MGLWVTKYIFAFGSNLLSVLNLTDSVHSLDSLFHYIHKLSQ
jgi:hypothetical protein